MKIILASIAALGLAGCANLTATQRANLQLQLDVAKQIGQDVVRVWCASSGIIYIVANDINAQSRLSVALGKNAKAATDVCPMLQQPSVVVTTQAAPTTGVQVK